jgi:HEAT repeat protein
MSDPNIERDITQVAAWLDDLARRETAIEGISALGPRAVEPLACYLQRGPQPISQSRVLAVEMLGRLHDARVPELLRELLRSHPLHDLSSDLVECEYRVKDAAIRALVAQQKATQNDIAWAIQSERLPSAVRAAGALKMVSLLPSVVDLLTDDVLASPVESALNASLPESIQPVLAAIRIWLDPSKDAPRIRLALIRAFRWLAATNVMVLGNLTDQALDHGCSMVRSAAALVVHDTQSPSIVEALLHGVLSREPILACACRDRLQKVGQPLIEPALGVLRADTERDVYGNAHSSDIWGRYWLLIQLLQLTRHDVTRLYRVMAVVSEDELVVGLHRWTSPSAASLKELIRYTDSYVRAAAAAAVERLDPVESGRWLADRLGDTDRHVRWQAYTALQHRIRARYVRLSFADIPLAAWGLNPLRCFRLLMMSKRP